MVGLLFWLGTLLAIWTSDWLPTIQRSILEGEGIRGQCRDPAI